MRDEYWEVVVIEMAIHSVKVENIQARRKSIGRENRFLIITIIKWLIMHDFGYQASDMHYFISSSWLLWN